MSDSTSSSLDLINLLHNLKRCTALVESAFPANHEDNQVKRERFWKDFISTKEDPMGNLDLLKGYLEIESRIQEWVLVENTCAYSETLDSSNVEQNAHEYFSLNGDKHDNEDSLFYELALDERTRPICDVYGVRTTESIPTMSQMRIIHAGMLMTRMPCVDRSLRRSIIWNSPCAFLTFVLDDVKLDASIGTSGT